MRKVEATLKRTFATNGERKTFQRRPWNIAAKVYSAALFSTVTPNETGNATVGYFSGDTNKENLDKVCLNDIPSNSARIQIAGKDPVACDLFFSNILEILIEHMIGFDMKSKLPK